MGWGKALSAVIVMSISVMLVVSVLPVGAAGNDNGNGKNNSPLMYRSGDCNYETTAKCMVFIDDGDGICDPLVDKWIMLPVKVAKNLWNVNTNKECRYH